MDDFIPWIHSSHNISLVDIERDFGFMTISEFFDYDSASYKLDTISIIIKYEPHQTILMASYDLKYA